MPMIRTMWSVVLVVLAFNIQLDALQMKAGNHGGSRRGDMYMAAMKKSNKSNKSNKVRVMSLRAIPLNGEYLQAGVSGEEIRSNSKLILNGDNGGSVATASPSESFPTFYLGPGSIEVVERPSLSEDDCKRAILKAVLPVPMRSRADQFTALQSALQSDTVDCDGPLTAYDMKVSGSAVVDRDGGVFDQLCSTIPTWLGKSFTTYFRKDFYDTMQRTRHRSAYHLFVTILRDLCGLEVTGIIAEVADSPNEESLSLGAAILVTRIDDDDRDSKLSNQDGAGAAIDGEQSLEAFLEELLCPDMVDGLKKDLSEEDCRVVDWTMTVNNYRAIIREQTLRDSRAKLINCYLDEALGIHLATGVDITCERSLYERAAVDVVLEHRAPTPGTTSASSSTPTAKKLLRGPYFDASEEQMRARDGTQDAQARAQQQKRDSVRPEDISDASTFLTMSYKEKRSCLRAYGATLPRPREGRLKVDALLLNLIDVEVAYEVIRRLGESNGDYEEAALMEDNDSRRPALACLYQETLQKGDLVAAQEYSDQINRLATMRYDPTDPREAEMYERWGEAAFKDEAAFDIEEWYWQQRRVMYDIPA